MLTLNDGRNELWQWDTGRTLSVPADCSQVHFSNKVFGRSVDVDVVNGVAIIPDVLLQTEKDLNAWAFVGTVESGYTKISKVFKVNKRNKPADYVFTPPEQTTLGELIERLDKIEESQDPDVIKNAVDDYLANNPIEIDETDPTVPEWAKAEEKPTYTAFEVGALPADTKIPNKTSDLTNDSGFITGYTETDPTVPAWAKAESKPSYTKSEVGLGNVDNVKQYSANNPPPYPVTSVNGQTGAVKLDASDVGARPDDWMPTAQDVGALPSTYTPPNQTAAQVGADPAGTADSKVSAHNTQNDAHNDIRLLITALTNRLDALANSDDTTLDQMAEVVAYIKDNRGLIEQITTGKVSVSDIVNNLTTNVANKPLSAAQGVALKALIDAITVPTQLSQLSGDSTHRTVTDTEKATWDAKSDFSGKYADLSGKPTIPTVPTNVSAFTNDAGYLTQHQDISGKLDASALPTAINTALAQAKASGEFDGAKGDPGTSVTHSWSGTTLSVTSASGTSSANLKGDKGDKGDSVKGDKGDTGSRGFSVLRITTAPSGYTTATGGFTPTYRVALSTVLSQSKSANVVVGDTIVYSYYTYPVGYVDASYVYLGARVSIQGSTGAAGKTPVLGTDYFTPADQEAIVQQVITALGTPVFGTVDLNNRITLSTEHLAEGTYELGYEDEDGNWVSIGTINNTSEPTYTNVLPLAIDKSGNVYNGTGYKVGARIGSSGSEGTVSNPSATNPIFLTGYILAPAGATISMKNCFIDTNGVNGAINNTADKNYYGHDLSGLYGCITYNDLNQTNFNANTTNYTWQNFASYSLCTPKPSVDGNGYVTEFTLNTTATQYIRMHLGGDPTKAIITVNEPITD